MSTQGNSVNNGIEGFTRNYGGRAAYSSNWRASATPVAAGLGSNLARIGGTNLVPLYSASVQRNGHLNMSSGVPHGGYGTQAHPATPSDIYATAMDAGSGVGAVGGTAGHSNFLTLFSNSAPEVNNAANMAANSGVNHGAGNGVSGISGGHGYSNSMGNASSVGPLTMVPSHSADIASLHSLRGPSLGPGFGSGYASASIHGSNVGNKVLPLAADFPMTYAYCIQRSNGTTVPLVPADLLPPLHDIPATIHDVRNVTILPVPAGLAPNGRSFYHREIEVLDNSNHIDSLVARAGPSNGNNRQKRLKIYCDKWVHDGTCAFTQQGCKFKHEMPFDKSTQHELGLFHGLPNWWKKQQSELQRQQDLQTTGDQPIDLGHAGHALVRRNATPAGPSTGQTTCPHLFPGPKQTPVSNGHNHSSAAQFGAIGTGRSVGASHGGQINATPTRPRSDTVRGNGIADHNRFATLNLEETTAEGEGSEEDIEEGSGTHVITRDNQPASSS